MILFFNHFLNHFLDREFMKPPNDGMYSNVHYGEMRWEGERPREPKVQVPTTSE